MASINYEDYENNLKKFEDETDEETLTVGSRDVVCHYKLIKEENILIEFHELQYDEELWVEVWMSKFGRDFKMRVGIMNRKEWEDLDIADYLIYVLEEHRNCLDCKSECLDDLCMDQYLDEEEEDDEDEET